MKEGRITIPLEADPFVQEVYRIRRQKGVTLDELCDRTGLHRNTVDGWRRHSQPKAAHIEACLNAMGYRLAIVPIEDAA